MHRRAVADLDEDIASWSEEEPEQGKDPRRDPVVAAYMAEVRRHALLTPKREIELGKMIEPILIVRSGIKKLSEGLVKRKTGYGEPDPHKRQALKDEIALLREEEATIFFSESFLSARKELIECNLRWVLNIARRFTDRGLPFKDVVQEGNIGLMKAAEKYNWHLGFRFCTYSAWWIRQSITRAIVTYGSTVRLPSYLYELLPSVLATRAAYIDETGFVPTVPELAKRCGKTEAVIERVLTKGNMIISLEAPIGGADTPFINALSYEGGVSDDAVTRMLLSERIEWALGHALNPREREFVERKFGLVGLGETLRAIGLNNDLSHERVRQIIVEAIRKLKADRYRVKLVGFL